jgi:hypothetical protein
VPKEVALGFMSIPFNYVQSELLGIGLAAG